ncbi:hypothetical protein IE53DRAFT_379215 [Violaceomyces palustris]|uniref:Uncharacterized protein n=1 Tax=Violaceomyces palustris TaxID=1673888 RepID=A0ACD0NZA0_9BASI|nr:hypothetical protein IE53DRAFT_379215 [Violaceomyces palustris]
MTIFHPKSKRKEVDEFPRHPLPSEEVEMMADNRSMRSFFLDFSQDKPSSRKKIFSHRSRKLSLSSNQEGGGGGDGGKDENSPPSSKQGGIVQRQRSISFSGSSKHNSAFDHALPPLPVISTTRGQNRDYQTGLPFQIIPPPLPEKPPVAATQTGRSEVKESRIPTANEWKLTQKNAANEIVELRSVKAVVHEEPKYAVQPPKVEGTVVKVGSVRTYTVETAVPSKAGSDFGRGKKSWDVSSSSLVEKSHPFAAKSFATEEGRRVPRQVKSNGASSSSKGKVLSRVVEVVNFPSGPDLPPESSVGPKSIDGMNGGASSYPMIREKEKPWSLPDFVTEIPEIQLRTDFQMDLKVPSMFESGEEAESPDTLGTVKLTTTASDAGKIHPGATDAKREGKDTVVHVGSASNPSMMVDQVERAKARLRKKGKASSTLNVVVMGGKGLGKSSWCELMIKSDIARDWKGASQRSLGGRNDVQRNKGADPKTGFIKLPDLEFTIPKRNASGSISKRGSSASSLLLGTKSKSSSEDREGRCAGGDKLILSMTDTPGIDFHDGDSVTVERQLRRVIDDIEGQFSKTLEEEGKPNRIPQDLLISCHFHLVLYFFDPERLAEVDPKRLPSSAHVAYMRSVNSLKELGGGGGHPPHGSRRKANSDRYRVDLPTPSNDERRKHGKGGIMRRRGRRRMKVSSKFSQEFQPRLPGMMEGSDFTNSTPEFSSGSDASSSGEEVEDGLSQEVEQEEEEDWEDLCSDEARFRPFLSPPNNEIYLLQRLSQRCAIVPVIGKADTVTENELREIRRGIKKAFRFSGIPLAGGALDDCEITGEGVRRDSTAGRRVESFLGQEDEISKKPFGEGGRRALHSRVSSEGIRSPQDDGKNTSYNEHGVKVIKLKTKRSFSVGGEILFNDYGLRGHSGCGRDNKTRSTTKLGLSNQRAFPDPLGSQESGLEESDVEPSLGSSQRGSFGTVQEPESTLAEAIRRIPFALISPESFKLPRSKSGSNYSSGASRKGPSWERTERKGNSVGRGSRSLAYLSDGSDFLREEEFSRHSEASVPPVPPLPPSSRSFSDHGKGGYETASRRRLTRDVQGSDHHQHAWRGGEGSDDRKGARFVRKYKWGTIDVLDPNHCDFLMARRCLLIQAKAFRAASQSKYENYRRVKLLARKSLALLSSREKESLMQKLRQL